MLSSSDTDESGNEEETQGQQEQSQDQEDLPQSEQERNYKKEEEVRSDMPEVVSHIKEEEEGDDEADLNDVIHQDSVHVGTNTSDELVVNVSPDDLMSPSQSPESQKEEDKSHEGMK